MEFLYDPVNNKYGLEGFVTLIHRWTRGNIQQFLDGMTQAEFCLMMHIGYNHYILHVEDIRNVDLVEEFHVSAPAISRMLGNLEKRGLVTRYSKEEDKRNSCVSLTPKGLQMVSNSRDNLDVFFDRVVERMGKDRFYEMVDLMYCFNEMLVEVVSEKEKRYCDDSKTDHLREEN